MAKPNAKPVEVGTDGIERRERKMFGKVILEWRCPRCRLWLNILKHDTCLNCDTLDKITG